MAKKRKVKQRSAKKPKRHTVISAGGNEVLLEKAMAYHRAGRLAEAEPLYRQLVNHPPIQDRVLACLGLLAEQTGHPAEAVNFYRQAVALKPQSRDYLISLANILKAVKQGEEAVQFYERVLLLEPHNLPALNNMGLVLYEQNKFTEALPVFTKAAGIAPHQPEVHNNKGLVLAAQDHYDDALAAFDRAVELKPDYVEAWNNRATVLKHQGRFKEAVVSCQHAEKLDPHNLQTQVNLGTLYRTMGKYQQAISCYERVLAKNDQLPEVLVNMANALTCIKKDDIAVEYYQKALTLQPGLEPAIGGLAQIYQKQGEYEKAYQHIKPLILKGKELDPGIVAAFAELSRRFGEENEAIAIMEALLSSGAISVEIRLRLHFLLGKLLDAAGRFDEAFVHYQQANAQKKSFRHLNNLTGDLEDLMAAFNRRDFPEMARATSSDRRPLFIIGMPRSGTSLVEQILSCHPQVHAAGELETVQQLVSELYNRSSVKTERYPFILPRMDAADFERLARRYTEQFSRVSPDVLRITDKMPLNFLHVGLIKLLFPEAGIIHCRRDPLDTCLSGFFQDFTGHYPYFYSLDDLATFFKGYDKIMNHWLVELGVEVLDVYYEHLVSDQVGQSQRLLAYCGLSWDDRCERFYESGHKVQTASYEQVRQPIYTTSVARWRNYAAHIKPLIDGLSAEHAQYQQELNQSC